MSDLSTNSAQDIFKLLRQTYQDGPALNSEGCHNLRQIGKVCEFKEAEDSKIAEGNDSQTFYLKANHGVAAAYWKTKDWAGLDSYRGEFYSKTVTLNNSNYTVQAVRYNGIAVDSYDVVLLNEKLEEVARKTDDGDWTGYTSLLSAALTTFCEIENRPLQSTYANPLDARTRVHGYAVCKE